MGSDESRTASDEDLIHRFARTYGTPNLITEDALEKGADREGKRRADGRDNSGYDLENTNYILAFGANIIESETPLARNLREADTLVRIAKALHVPTAYFENQLHMPAIIQARQQLAEVEKVMGPAHLARSAEEHGGPHKPWFWDPTTQGGLSEGAAGNGTHGGLLRSLGKGAAARESGGSLEAGGDAGADTRDERGTGGGELDGGLPVAGDGRAGLPSLADHTGDRVVLGDSTGGALDGAGGFLDRALDGDLSVPSSIEMDGITVGPGQMLQGLLEFYAATRAGQTLESVKLSGLNLPVIADEPFFSQETFTREIYPEGFEGRNICKMCRLQSWSWKPALRA